MLVIVSFAVWALFSVAASEFLSSVDPYAALDAKFPSCDSVGVTRFPDGGIKDCQNGKGCVTCDFFERIGPQGPRSYCIAKFYNDPCSELKMIYYPDIDPASLWGFHGNNDPNIINFVNRYHEERPIVTPNGELIIYPKESSELPPSEAPDPDQVLLAENNFGSADDIFGAPDSTIGVADNTFAPASNTFGGADTTLGGTENLFGSGDANGVPVNDFLGDYS